ncbi:hypothetical protein [Streptomyces griseus]|uniref:hypothetical protein n=1 Tax=Streptomyces griseus TaxID=1911 RepID=UPI0004C581C3|nr:hypothetical protein [Streptomyces griseus]
MSSRPHTPALPRLFKAVVVTLIAVGASHVVLSDTLRFSLVAQASSALGAPTGYSADQAFTAALMNTALLMPFVLWAGMRLAGERSLGAMVLVGSTGWIVTVWRGIDALDDSFGAILPLRSLALVVGVTALASLVRRCPSPASAAPSAPRTPPAPIRPENVSETTPAS